MLFGGGEKKTSYRYVQDILRDANSAAKTAEDQEEESMQGHEGEIEVACSADAIASAMISKRAMVYLCGRALLCQGVKSLLLDALQRKIESQERCGDGGGENKEEVEGEEGGGVRREGVVLDGDRRVGKGAVAGEGDATTTSAAIPTKKRERTRADIEDRREEGETGSGVIGPTASKILAETILSRCCREDVWG